MEKELEKEIKEVQDFTNSYWKPLQEELNNEIIDGIIENRYSYVRELQDYLKHSNPFKSN